MLLRKGPVKQEVLEQLQGSGKLIQKTKIRNQDDADMVSDSGKQPRRVAGEQLKVQITSIQQTPNTTNTEGRC